MFGFNESYQSLREGCSKIRHRSLLTSSLTQRGRVRDPAAPSLRASAPLPHRRCGRGARFAFFENAFFENAFLQNFANFWRLVLGCIKTKFCNKICVWQHFSRSTRFAHFCTAGISKCYHTSGNSLKNQQLIFRENSAKTFANVANSAKFCQI